LKRISTFEENITADPLKRIRKTEKKLFHHDRCYPNEYLIQTVLTKILKFFHYNKETVRLMWPKMNTKAQYSELPSCMKNIDYHKSQPAVTYTEKNGR